MKYKAVQAGPSNNNKTNNEYFETKKKYTQRMQSCYCPVINVLVILSYETSRKSKQKMIIILMCVKRKEASIL